MYKNVNKKPMPQIQWSLASHVERLVKLLFENSFKIPVTNQKNKTMNWNYLHDISRRTHQYYISKLKVIAYCEVYFRSLG